MTIPPIRYLGGIIMGTDLLAAESAAFAVINAKRFLEKVAPGNAQLIFRAALEQTADIFA